eukprot:s2470_g4.t1
MLWVIVGEGVLTSQYVDTPLGETLVAVVAGASEAVTTAGASVKLDAELMQQLGGEPLVLSVTSLSDTAAEQFGAELAVPVSISLWSLQGSRISVSNAVVPLQIRIPTNNSEAQCVFWNETLEEWSSDGLTRDGVLICESTHLTIFNVLWQQFGIALRCSTAPALLSAEGLSAFGRFPGWLGYSSSLIVILSLFFFGLCMGSAVGSDRLAEQKVGKEELAFVVKTPAPASKCCAPALGLLFGWFTEDPHITSHVWGPVTGNFSRYFFVAEPPQHRSAMFCCCEGSGEKDVLILPMDSTSEAGGSPGSADCFTFTVELQKRPGTNFGVDLSAAGKVCMVNAVLGASLIGEWNRMMDQRGPKEHAIRAYDRLMVFNDEKPAKGADMVERLHGALGAVTLIVQRPRRQALRVRRKQTELGIQALTSGSGFLLITRINGYGVFADHNASAPEEDRVKIPCRLVKVDGQSGNGEALLRFMEESQKTFLDLEILIYD